SEPIRRRIRIPFLYRDMIHRDSQFLRENLRVGGLVTLPLRLGPKSCDDFSCGMNADLGAIEHFDAEDVEVFRGPGAHDSGEVRDADPHYLASFLLLCLFRAERKVADLLHGFCQSSAIVTAVVLPTQHGLVRKLLRSDKISEAKLSRVHI